MFIYLTHLIHSGLNEVSFSDDPVLEPYALIFYNNCVYFSFDHVQLFLNWPSKYLPNDLSMLGFSFLSGSVYNLNWRLSRFCRTELEPDDEMKLMQKR